jgi:hypothetical protein
MKMLSMMVKEMLKAMADNGAAWFLGAGASVAGFLAALASFLDSCAK